MLEKNYARFNIVASFSFQHPLKKDYDMRGKDSTDNQNHECSTQVYGTISANFISTRLRIVI